ncbi:MAG TPA: class I SAM-dependent methyltransferase [Thermoanaerobaculia bacterium]|nr:class I SAM-dependent methyltransferase [Thermoanaerobaculia bacterium]
MNDSYDLVPYRSGSHHQSHPDNLATIAWLAGLEPAPPERCRVLELGCATGGNVIAMAFELPSSAFTGIDLSAVQIEKARGEAAALGLANADFRVMSIADAAGALGPFDYIVCHGVFSWVEPAVQEAIFDVCRDHLAPHGVAYVSYNTFPGWYQRRAVREMLRFHTQAAADPLERVSRAHALADFFADCAADAPEPHAAYLRTARDLLESHRDDPSYVLHEYLAETNEPLFFHEFAARAAAHGLSCLGDAEPHETELDNLGMAAAERLRAMTADPIEQQQTLDFLVNRTFRRTLLCHAEARRDSGVRIERVRALHAASACTPESSAPDLRAAVVEHFTTERGKAFSSGHPIAKATLVALRAAWPRALRYDALLACVAERLRGAGVPDDPEPVLADLLDSFYRNGVATLHTAPPRCTNVVSRFPCASALARRQAAQGVLVTNQRRWALKLDDAMARFLLTLLDGTHDRAALARLLDREASAGRLSIAAGDDAVDPRRIAAVLDAVLEHHLRKMAHLALLVG